MQKIVQQRDGKDCIARHDCLWNKNDKPYTYDVGIGSIKYARSRYRSNGRGRHVKPISRSNHPKNTTTSRSPTDLPWRFFEPGAFFGVCVRFSFPPTFRRLPAMATTGRGDRCEMDERPAKTPDRGEHERMRSGGWVVKMLVNHGVEARRI
jgi:hypothetical protein